MSEPAAPQGAPATPPAGSPATPPASAPAEGGAAPAAAEAKADAAQEALDTAKQKPGETNTEFETRISKLTRESRQARSEVERLKAALSDRDSRLKQLDEEMQKAKSKRWTRRDYLSLTKAINEANGDDGKLNELFDPEEMLAAVPKEIRDQLEELRKDKKAREERDAAAQQEAGRAREVGIVTKAIGERADECPLFEIMPGAAEYVLDEWHERWRQAKRDPSMKPDLDEVMREMHAPLVKNIVAALQSERSRSFLLKASPELKALLGGHEVGSESPKRDAQGLGGGNGPAAAPESPAQRPSTPAGKDRHRTLQEEDRIRASVDAYKELQRSVRGG